MTLAAFALALVLGDPRIAVWQRTAGNHAENVLLDRAHLIQVPLGALPEREIERADPHTGATLRFRGFHLQVLLERYAPPRSADLALLHFANGMIIPVPFRDAATMKRVDPFVARYVWQGNRWTSAFPEVHRGDPPEADARPITFAGNKLVVADPRHPAQPTAAQRAFSPWEHADSLVGVEIVRAAAYWGELGTEGDARGAALHRDVCAFCHGLAGVGASYGPDLLEPVAVPAFLTSKQLFHHLRSRPDDAAARGLGMPALPFVAPSDAVALRRWLQALVYRGVTAYEP